MPTLPDDLIIAPLYLPNPVTYSDWEPAFISVDRYTTLEVPEGIFTVTSFDRVVDVLKAKHYFTISPPGKFDSLLRFLPGTSLYALELGLAIEYRGWSVTYRGYSLKFVKGRQNKYLWNLWKFFNLPREPSDLNEVYSLVELLFYHLDKNGVHYSHLTSPASVSRSMTLSRAWQEFAARDMDWNVLVDAYSACHGGRSESTGIGTVDVWNYDMRQAHLQILNSLDSIRGTQYRQDWPLISEASYGLFLISCKIPVMRMCPLPVELSEKFSTDITWPYGEISGWYAKPFIELLGRMGLKYQLFKSHQWVPVKSIEPPFKRLVHDLRDFTRKSPKWLNSKAFYYGIVGSTISWRWVVTDTDTGDMSPVTYNVFNPLLYATVLATQSVKVYEEANKANPVAIRSDAVTVRNRLSTGLKTEDHGSMLFVNPTFKAFPSGRGAEWKQLVETYRDDRYLEYYTAEFPTLTKHVRLGLRLGKLHERLIKVTPNHGHRKGVKPVRIGHLLDTWLPSRAASMDDMRHAT